MNNQSTIITVITSPLLVEAIKTARQEIGVREDPPGSNSGPRIKEYLNSVKLGPDYPWCAAFVYWCFEQASVRLNRVNPVVRTAACMNHWKRTKGVKILTLEAVYNPLLIEPGDVFIISLGHGKGHTGIVTGIEDDYIQTIEGNTNAGHSANGGSVLALRRKIDTISQGFIKYN
jgi:hypothetical protein